MAETAIAGVLTGGYMVDGNIVDLPEKPLLIPNGNEVQAITPIGVKDIIRIASSSSYTGFGLHWANRDLFLGFEIHLPDSAKQTIRNYAADCVR